MGLEGLNKAGNVKKNWKTNNWGVHNSRVPDKLSW